MSPTLISETCPKREDSGRAAWFLLGASVTTVLLFFSLRSVQWINVWRIIAGAHWQYFAIAIVFTCSGLFHRALRWRVLLSAQHRFSVKTVFCAHMAGYAGNTLLPARAGELVRTFLISAGSSVGKTYVLTTALTERVMDFIVLTSCCAAAVMTIEPRPIWMSRSSRVFLFVGAVSTTVMIVLPYTGGMLDSVLLRLPLSSRLRQQIRALAQQVISGVSSLHSRRRIANFAVLTAIIWLSDIVATVVAARALDIHISFPVAVLLITGLGIGSILPLAPGNLGLYPFVAVSILPLFGISRDGALAFSLMSQFTWYIVILSLGLTGLYALQGSGLKSVLALISSSQNTDE